METFVALLLTIQASGAVITKQGSFTMLETCRAYQLTTRVRPNQTLACVSADQLDLLTQYVWRRPASEIWK